MSIITNSFFVKLVFAILTRLNYWYEFSITHKAMVALGNLCKKSFMVGPIVSAFTTRGARDYIGGSILLKYPIMLVGFIFACIKKIFAGSNNSVTMGIVRGALGIFIKDGFIKRTIVTSVPGKIISWLLINENTHTQQSKNLLFAVGFSLFMLFMAIVPYGFWSNMFILAAAVLFWGIFALQYFLGISKGVDTKYLSVSLILFALFCVISIFTGFGGMDSVRVVSIMFSAIALSILMINILDTVEKIHTFVFIVAVALVLTSLFGLLQWHTGIAIRTDFIDLEANVGMGGRLYSTMGNPNNYAKFLTMFFPICVSYIVVSQGFFKRVFLSALLVPVVVALVLTLSRASYLVFAASLGFYIFMLKPRIVPVAVALGLLSMPFWPDMIMARLSTLGTDTSSIYRMWIWEGSLRTMLAYWVTGIGVGPNAFNMVYRAHAHQLASNAMHAHNVFLQVWIELGIGGFVAIVVYNISTFRKGLVSFLNAKSPEGGGINAIRFYIVGGLSSLVGFIMFSFVEHVWFHPRTMLTYFIIMGFIWACVRAEERV